MTFPFRCSKKLFAAGAALLAAGMGAGYLLGSFFGAAPLIGCREQDLSPVPDTAFLSPASSSAASSVPSQPEPLPEKWVCLTFDDGPSKTTPAVLKALNAAGVKATFFVVATDYNEKYLPLLTEAAAAGHQIALHSASHEYSDIYRSTDAYWQDIALLKKRIAPYVDGEAIRYLRFPGGSSYIESVIGKLKKDGLLRSYTKNGLRGLRLTASAKRLLLQKYPVDLAPYLTGASETNSLKSEPERRLRLHRMAEALQILHNAQIPSLPWEKPSIQDWRSNPTLFPVYYSSREFKSLGSLCTKIRNSRMTGVLFTEQAIFPVYNMASTFPRWAYNAEIRLKAVLQTEFCRNAQFAISGIVFASSPIQIPAILNDMAQNHFLLDGSYPHFYFLTLDHFGEVGTIQLCQPDIQEQLNEILSENLQPPSPAMPIEHDALEQDGSPVLFSYLCDLPRLHRFRCALTLRNLTGSILCCD